ncbi:DNRLRE domain-containing protein [Massilia sp. IC2-476]|uniref:DNRLRE domain-containing protein n=1 Tax=Massilia sp. IC2-476 TaxID=2887199 RepID=UPI001D12DB05|nr:DNRLRE domain-containing protein [Massilia sp. IC2-476]MCC2972865.1 DNRLRE domain-containing protein [Massilia sp. IC2-476]
MKRQHGLLLLPVALALSVMGALAYAMTRGAADDASAVDAQYELDATRYLAEAGVRLAKWQNEKINCDSDRRFVDVRLPGVAGTMTADSITIKKKDELDITVTARSARGTVSTITREKMMFYDRTQQYDMVLDDDDDFRDTWINSNAPATSYGDSSDMVATDGGAHPLLSVDLNNLPPKSRVTKATLWLYLSSSNSVQTVRELAVHAVSRSWSEGTATWNSPWNTSPGGSYEVRPEWVTTIAGTNRFYRWDIGPLMRRWQGGELANFGMLFKPLGLNDARFNSTKANNNEPRMDISYHKRCD